MLVKPLVRPIVRAIAGNPTASLGSVGFTYYVDSVSGSNANAGTSPLAPFQTLSAVPTLTTGQSVGLKRGSTWREKLTVTVNNVVIGAYGTGNRPIIDCSDVVSAGSWSKTGGYVNVYQVTLTVQPDANATEWPALWINGVRCPVVASLAALDAAPGSIYHGAVEGLSSIVLYVHSTGSTNPGSDGKTYEAAVRSSGIDCYSAENTTIIGIHGKRNYASYGSITLGRYSKAINCLMEDGNTHCFFMRAFSEAIDCTAKNAYNHTTGPTLYVAFEPSAPAGATAIYTRCRAESDVYIDPCSGFYNHTSGGTFASVSFNDCSTNNVRLPFASANTGTIYVTGGTVTNFTTVFDVNSVNVSCTGLSASQAKSGAHWGNFTGAGLSITVDRCTAVFDTSGYIRPLTAGQVITLTNCTITGANSILRTSISTASFVVTDNVFIPNGRMSVIWDFTTSAPTMNSDRNNYGGATGVWQYSGVSYPNLAALQAGISQDLNSVA